MKQGGNNNQFRVDIEGLRAVAVLGVVVFHLNLPFLAGGYVGVDIFFVISGFLISGILLREFEKTGRIDFVNFWSRRFRRLMPAALLVIIVTLIYLLGTSQLTALQKAAKDGIYAILYLTNWQKMFEAVDYFNDGFNASPFIHYWSLAVEEQFYVIICLLFLCYVGISRRLNSQFVSQRNFVVLLFVLGLVSFASSVYFTKVAQAYGFFGTYARFWQFLVGIVCMIIVEKKIPLSTFVARTGSIIGLAVIILSLIFLKDEARYPGYLAFIPTLGTALVLVTPKAIVGTGMMHAISHFLLSLSPLRFIGRISYSLYLWHWPVIVLFLNEKSSWIGIVAISLLMFALSVASYYLVENKLRYASALQNKGYASIASGFLASVTCIIIGTLFLKFANYQLSVINLPSGMKIAVEDVRKETPIINSTEPRCHLGQKEVSIPESCEFGDVNSERVIVLFGDSHAGHWFTALEQAALSNGFKLLSRTKSACSPIDFPTWNRNFNRPYTECDEWRQNVLKELGKLEPEFVFIGSSKNQTPILNDQVIENREEAHDLREKLTLNALSKYSELANRIFLISDTPWFSQNALECLAEARDPSDCARSRESALKGSFPWVSQSDIMENNITILDFNDSFCDKIMCYPYNDNMVTFRDAHHITANFSKSLANQFDIYLVAD